MNCDRTQTFSTAAIASVLSGKSLCESFSEVYALVGFLTGDSGVSSQELEQYTRLCRPFLLKQLPKMADVALMAEVWNINNETIAARFVDYLVELHGEIQTIKPLPYATQEYIQYSFLYQRKS